MRSLWVGVLAACWLACGTTTAVEPPPPPVEEAESPSPDAGLPPPEETLPDAGPVAECVPLQCAWRDIECGPLPDGCGGIADCGVCPRGEVCGALKEGLCDPCPLLEDLGSTLPVHREGRPSAIANWDEAGDFYSVYRWVAPEDGTYGVDLAGSGPDVSFSLRHGDCRGQTLAGASEGSRVAKVRLARGEEVFIVLHGHGWERSTTFDYQLHIGRWSPDERERCSDRWDNDADGQADCFDPDCAQTEACGNGDACTDVELGSGLPVRYAGPERVYYARDFFSAECFVLQHRGERVYRWTAPADGTYHFTTHDDGASISLHGSCRGAALACDSAISPDIGPARRRPIVSRNMSRGESVLIAVEGTLWDGIRLPIPKYLSIFPSGPEETLAQCSDGLDNDGDGVTDRDDRGCPNYE